MRFMRSLAHELLGQTRSAVLGALFLHPESALHVRELARLTGASAGSLHRELRFLADLDLLQREEVGRQVFYKANTAHSVFDELRQFLRKTSGIADVVREALVPLGDRIEVAFVYGSVAAGTERPASDIDVMVLGRATFADLARALRQAQDTLMRDVNPAVMTRAEFANKLVLRDSFVQGVMKGAKLWLKGSERDLAQLAKDRPPQGARTERKRSSTPAGVGASRPRRRKHR